MLRSTGQPLTPPLDALLVCACTMYLFSFLACVFFAWIAELLKAAQAPILFEMLSWCIPACLSSCFVPQLLSLLLLCKCPLVSDLCIASLTLYFLFQPNSTWFIA